MKRLAVLLCSCLATPLWADEPASKNLAYGDFRLTLPPGKWLPINDVAADAVAAISRELEADGGGLSFKDDKSQILVQAIFGVSLQDVGDVRRGVEKFHRFADGYFTAGWQVTKRGRSESGNFLLSNSEGTDGEGLSMITSVAAAVDRGAKLHGGGVQCVFPTKDAAKLAPACRSLLGTFKLAVKELKPLPKK